MLIAGGALQQQVVFSFNPEGWAPDSQTRKKFAFYWRLISFGSGWIRVLWLHAIKRRAERAGRL